MKPHRETQARLRARVKAKKILAGRFAGGVRLLELPDWCDEVDRVIVGYYHQWSGPTLRAKLGIKRQVYRDSVRRLRDAGLIDPAQRAANAPITEAERNAVLRLSRLGYSRGVIASMRGVRIGRIARTLKLAGYAAATPRPRLHAYSSEDVARMFGVSGMSVRRWRQAGWLPDNRAHSASGSDHSWPIADLIAFVENRETWPAWSLSQVADSTLHKLATHARRIANGRWMQQKELAALLGVTATTLSVMMRQGFLAHAPRAVGYPDRWVTHEELAQIAAIAGTASRMTPWHAQRYVAAQLRARCHAPANGD
jgi:hypothetical protein